MPADYNPNSVPHGNGTITIDAVVFKVNSWGSSPNVSTDQLIHEPDENGKAQTDRYAIIDGADLVERTIEVQRLDSTVAAPVRGDTAVGDHDRSGTASTWTVKNCSTARDKTNPDVFNVDLILDTYQG